MQSFARLDGRLMALVVTLAVAAGAPGTAQKPTTARPDRTDDRTMAHVLNRLGFGPRPGDLERVRSSGLAAYIERQLQPERIPDEQMSARLAALTTLGKSSRELAALYFVPAQMARQQRQRAAQDPTMQDPPREMGGAPPLEAVRGERLVLLELSQQKVLRAAYSERQLEEVMVDFWFNHFNVFAGKGPTRTYLTEYERDTIRPHALGRFRDLLHATARSPAMLFYLDNWQSAAAPDAGTTNGDARPVRGGRQGLRNPRGTNPPTRPGGAAQMPQPRRARGLNENYARELMELHTLGVDGGYSQRDVQEVARAFTGWTIANPRQGGGFVFEPRMHDDGAKVVLGRRLEAGGGRRDGEAVLDLLAAHPSTARHIAMKLARRFVADDPPPALVERAAQRFQQTGGDIREVVRTIVTSAEFFAPAAYRAKIKTPFEFVVSAVRATGAEMPTAAPVVQALRNLGMPLYLCQPPTGYADRAEAWVNTGALLNRMNFALTLASGPARRMRPDAVPVSSDAIVSGIMAGDISAATAATVAKATAPAQAVALVLGSPDFQKR